MNKKKLFYILLIILVLIIIGVGLLKIFRIEKAPKDNNVQENNLNNLDNSNKDDSNLQKFYGLVEEKRYVNNDLYSVSKYSYNEDGIVDSMRFSLKCEEDYYGIYDCEPYKSDYAIGLFNYKYFISDNVIKKIYLEDLYSSDEVSIRFDEDGTPTSKYGVMFESEEKDLEVKYEYESGKLVQRTGYNYSNCDELICDKKHYTINSKVGFNYDDNDKLTGVLFELGKGTKYESSYKYDDNDNVIEFNLDMNFASEDGYIVVSGDDVGIDEKDNMKIEYYYLDIDEFSETINMNVYINDDSSLTKRYNIFRSYDSSGNLIEEKVDQILDNDKLENVYTRYLLYKQFKGSEYVIKMNKYQTKTYSILDYLYTDDYAINYIK